MESSLFMEPNASITVDRWVACQRQNDLATLRLFCFPYAGGGAQVFRRWQETLPENVEVCSIQLPGREARISEPAFTSLPPLVQAIAKALSPYLDKPFAFFGHSMGGLICFELAHQMTSRYGVSPHQLFISGCRAPQLPSLNPPIHELPDSDFLEEIKAYGATPDEVLENSELMQLLLPLLRSDFAVAETYAYTERVPLQCPITVFGGFQDDKVELSSLEAWRCHTDSAFASYMFPGGHFFLSTNRIALLQCISRDLGNVRIRPRVI